MRKIFGFLSLILCLNISLSAQSVEEMLNTARPWYDTSKEPAALDLYMKVLEKEPGNYEALWQSSLLMSRIGHRVTDQGLKERYFNNAKENAIKAMNANAGDAQGYFVMSVAMGRMALISPPKPRVAASKDIKKYAELALKYNPKHAGAWHVLGLWNYRVANLSWAEKTAANLLFGGAPEGASNENAENCYKSALKFYPNYILYMYDYAFLLSEWDREDEAKKLCEQILALPAKYIDDKMYQDQARQLLEDMK
ncbi:MAG: hypothetical protein H6581_17220 [Bacteroidia bacterium]|nr:hypothetical protein [Bacteroidia bacterium]